MKKLLLSLIALMIVLAGCSTGSKPIVVSVAPASQQAIDLGQSVSLTASVMNDSKNMGVSWAVSGPGTLTNSSTTGVTYVAPTTGTGGTATVTAASVSLSTATASVMIVVTAPPAITTKSLPAGTEGTAYSQSVNVTGGAGSLTYAISAGTLPSGLTLGTSGNITGTPTGPNTTSNFTVKVTDSSNATPQFSTQVLSIAINLPPAPAITTTTLPAVVEGAAYSQAIAVTGGLSPLTYSISAGALPAGLSINGSTGAITGTSTGPNGTANFTVKVVDSSNPAQSATQALSITVNLPPAPAITTTTLPAVVEGVAYSQTVAVTGGLAPLTFSISAGALPTGLTLNAGTGAITGTPTGPNGTASFTVKVTDKSNPAQSATKALSILVNLPAPPAISTTTLPAGTEFVSYNQTVAATGYAPLAYSVSSGTLPAGLTLNASTGAITGTPSGPNGSASFTIKVTDASNPVQSATQNLTLLVNLPAAPAITTTTLPNGTISTPYNQTIGFTGGHAPFVWSISAGTLPAGLTINASTGVISGSPTTQGTANFTVKLVDSSNPAQSATQALSISVVLGPLAVTAASLPTGAIGDVYPASNLGATGGLPPYTWSITSAAGTFPAGLALSSGGQITGTPTTAGTFNFTAQVKDSTNATASGNFSIIINALLAVSTASLPNGTVGTGYPSTALTATGGVTPYTWSVTVGALPGGLTLDSAGNLTGQPTASGTFNFTVKVADASGGSATKALSILVNPAAPLAVVTTSGTLPQGTLNTTYSTSLSASGGVQPYTWSITVGALPSGLALSTAGQITGTPTVSGTFNFTVQVKDSTNATATSALSLVVNSAACVGYATGNAASELQGQYAFLTQGFSGQSASSPFAAAGSIAADGAGNITAGEVDINAAGGPQHLSLIASGSSYVLGTDNRGCMVLNFGGSNVAVLHFAVGGISGGIASKGRVIEFDDATGTGTRISGIIRLQTKSTFANNQLTARYAFGLDGVDSTGGHVAVGGSFSTRASGTTITSGFADLDDAGTLIGPVTGATGTIGSISSTTGRATAFFNGGVGATLHLAVYVINANELFVVSTDALGASVSIVSGRAISTGSSFSSSSLSGKYIIHVGGSQSGVADATIGLLNLTGGTVNGTLWQYGLGSTPNARINTITNGTYTVDATSGRVTLTGTGNHPPVLYLTTPTDGISTFIIGSDTSAIFGAGEIQPSATYSTNSINGKYIFGTEDPSDYTVRDDVGSVTITGSTGAVNGLQDRSQYTSPFLQTGKTVSGTLVINADGTGNLGPNTVLLTNGSKIFFIDESGGPARITVVEQ